MTLLDGALDHIFGLFYFSVAGKFSHSACLTVCVLLLCVSVLEKENVFPSDERSEGEGRCIFLRKLARACMHSC